MPTLAARPASSPWVADGQLPRPASPARTLGLVVTAGLHALLLLALLFELFPSPSEGPPAAALVVTAALLPAAPPAPPPDLPVPRQPQPPTVPQVEPPRVTQQALPPTLPPPTQAPTLTEPPPAPAPVPPPSPPPEAAAAGPVLPVLAKAAAPVEAPPVSGARPTGQANWETQVLAHLERLKRYPAAARLRRQEDVVYVRFLVSRQGNVSGARIVRSQGFALLDEEVLALLKRAAPLPPMPADVPGEQIELMVPVEFFMRGASP